MLCSALSAHAFYDVAVVAMANTFVPSSHSDRQLAALQTPPILVSAAAKDIHIQQCEQLAVLSCALAVPQCWESAV